MRVSLFIPCLVDTLNPEIGEATEAVLSRLGLAIDYPLDQTCCGQAAFNAGHFEDARTAARNFLEVFAASEAIVAPSGSCVAMVRLHYPLLFAQEPRTLARAREIANRTYELSEFLVRVMKITDLGASFAGKTVFHESCHLKRGLGVFREPRALLDRVSGLETLELLDADRCCGFGGIFSIKHPETSAAMARRKTERALEAGAEVVAVCDPGCLIQLRGYVRRHALPLRVLHLAEILNR